MFLKKSSIDPSQQTDESGRTIYISTGCRMFFRKEISSGEQEFSSMRNEELTEFIAHDVSSSKNVKTFVPKSSSAESGKREIGVIKKSDKYNVYYVCIGSSSELRVISVKKEIKEGGEKKFSSLVETDITDPSTGLKVRVTTTVRKIFRQDYKTYNFPPQPEKTFENAGILELSNYIAELYAKNADNIKDKFSNISRSQNLMEIRSFGSNSYFVTALREGYADIVGVQGQYRSKKMKEKGNITNREDWSPSRLGRTPRKDKSGRGNV